jgi:leucyl aminopeptidase
MKQVLTEFTGFQNRLFNSTYGEQAANWLYDLVCDAIRDRKADGVECRKVKHRLFDQPSVIVRIPGTSSNERERNETVIIGAHLDSIGTQRFNPESRAPGADDDGMCFETCMFFQCVLTCLLEIGSGVVALVEILHILMKGTFLRTKRTIELHWYAAEEVGLRGSQDIATQYKVEQKSVAGMLMMDMIGYSPNKADSVIGIVTDFVDPALTELLRTLVATYVGIPFRERKCGRPCSDHASWNLLGFPACRVFESDKMQNPNNHSENDTVDTIDFDHVANFVKLTMAYALELADVDETT